MHEGDDIPEDVRDLIDEYLSGTLDVERFRGLEARLLVDAEARSYFVRYCGMHTDLALEARARQAGNRALQTIDRSEKTPSLSSARLARWAPTAAALILVTLGGWIAWWAGSQPHEKQDQREELAWLANAHNCQWAENMAPAGDMQAGKVLRLERGLAEVHFQKGARIVLEGPARLEIVSANSARLERGKVSAKVPESAKGFQIITPKGKVVDLGTEFALAVDDDGTTDVYVFSGKVEAHADANKVSQFLSLQEKQAARIDIDGVALKPELPAAPKPFVRRHPRHRAAHRDA